MGTTPPLTAADLENSPSAPSSAAALDDVDADVTDVIDLNASDTFLTSAEATLS